jgi:hypothetical protein
MSLRLVHLVSAYTLWCLGTYSLWLGEADTAKPYPILVALSAVVALVVTDGTKWICMPSWFSNALGLVILGKIIWDLSGLPQEALLALAHFLVYLQVAKWFREKRAFDFGLLYVMNILQLSIGAILARNTFGWVVLAYFLLAIWCAMLFFLGRHLGEIEGRAAPRAAAAAPAGLRLYASLAFRAVLLWIVGVPLALLVFWLLPRPSREEQVTSIDRSGQQWTGFSEAVTLQTRTNLVDSGEIAFRVWARDHNGSSVELPMDMLWRGSVCLRYDKGRWRRGLGSMELLHDLLRPKEDLSPGEVLLEFERVANTGSILFSPAGAVAAETFSSSSAIRRIPCEDRVVLDDGTGLPGGGPPRVNYRLVVDQAAWSSPFTSTPAPQEYLRAARQLPGGLERLRELADRLTEDLPPDDAKGRIQRILDHLTATGGFLYATSTADTGSGLDPIEDFLFVKKAGHCEYFAGSMALLLRCAGVPSRLVVGFKGIEPNRAGGFYTVRQLFAHAWVEAYDEGADRWLTIDPTPGEARENAVARAKGWFDGIVDAKDAVVRLWQYYVVSFTFEDQRRFLNGALHLSVDVLGRPLLALQAVVRSHWEDHAWLVVLAATGLAAGGATAATAARRCARTIAALFRRRRRERSLEGYRLIYEDFLVLTTERMGLRPQTGQTPWEFAEFVGRRLACDSGTRPFAGLPIDLTEYLYRRRFGGDALADDHEAALRTRLREFDRAISPRRQPRRRGPGSPSGELQRSRA